MVALAAAALLMTATAQSAYAQTSGQQQQQLTVSSQLENGTAITGYYTELYSVQDGSQEAQFTPAAFTVNNGQEYLVGVGDWLNFFFAFWLDDGSTSRWKSVTPDGQDVALTAVYRIETEAGQQQEGQEQTPATDSGSEGSGTGEGQRTTATTTTDSGASPSGGTGVRILYIEELAAKISVYKGQIPSANLSGHKLADGSSVMEYNSLYSLVMSGVDVPTIIRAAELAGVDWSSLTEDQQCFLAVVLSLNVPLDSNGMPV